MEAASYETPPPKVAEVKKKIERPSLPPKCIWGTVTMDGRYCIISDHETWAADGYLRADDSLYLKWWNTGGGTAVSVYRFKDGQWHGSWGWDTAAHIGPDGEIVGDVRPDVLKKVEP